MNVEVIKDLLINLLFVILPIYLYLLLGNKNPLTPMKKNVIFGAIGSILIILCMNFPITIIENHMFDLRQIPFIIGFLYMGRTTGLILFITIVVTRSFWGGLGFYGALFVNSLLMIALFLVHSKFASLSVKSKFLLTSALTLFSSILIHIHFMLFDKASPLLLSITMYLFIIQSIGLFIIIYSIEKMKKDTLIEKNLHKAEKANIVSELAAAVSHEIRNPLTVTKGFLQLVLSQPLPDKTKEYLKLAQEELAHAESVIGDYLTFAKPSLDNPAVLHLPDEIGKIVKLITPYANMQSIQIYFHCHKESKVIGESQKFHQCFSNILKNSIEAMPNGGSIRIELTQRDDQSVITIIDTGIGMTPEQIQRLGEPYFSTKEKGTGLGMMVVFGIIRSMRGKLQVSSEIGKGTQFVMEFPLA